MKTTKLMIVGVAIAAAFSAATAKSQNLTATLSGFGPGLPVSGTFNNGLLTEQYASGVLNFTEFSAFCVEPNQNVAFGQTLVYQVQNPGNLNNSNTVAQLVTSYLASPRTAQDAAAVQWAIWETVTETSSVKSLSDGNVRITPSASNDLIALANNYLNSAECFGPTTLTYLMNSNYQDQVSWNVVPEPTSLGLVALSGMLVLRRRRR
jgi:hypothetical protein